MSDVCSTYSGRHAHPLRPSRQRVRRDVGQLALGVPSSLTLPLLGVADFYKIRLDFYGTPSIVLKYVDRL